MNMCDLGMFFTKSILHIKEKNFIIATRTWLLGPLCIPAVREYYEYTVNP